MSAADSTDSTGALKDLRVAFAGKLGGMTKREAQNLVRNHGGTPVDTLSREVDMVVIGADELPLDEDSLLDESLRQRAAEGQLEVISETQLWQRLGMFDEESPVRLYTPAMLAELLSVPVSIIRRWHRRKLIVPVREVRRLPYFDFQEVATARQLATLLGGRRVPRCDRTQARGTVAVRAGRGATVGTALRDRPGPAVAVATRGRLD